MKYTSFELFFAGMWFAVIILITYLIIAIHSIPGEIARKRKHPQADAIETAAWVSLFFLQVLWPFLWIWAMTGSQKDFEKKEEEQKKHDNQMQQLIEAVKSSKTLEDQQLSEHLQLLETQNETLQIQIDGLKNQIESSLSLAEQEK